jgi:DoxX-like family
MEPATQQGDEPMSTLNSTFTLIPTAPSFTAMVPSRAARWTGRVMSTIVALLLGLDALMKLLRVTPVLKASVELGYPAHAMFGIGLVLAICVVAYVIPRTSLLGAVLLTGYLGGAIATHVRVDHPLWTHTLFPIYVAAVIWGGLVLRDSRVRGILRACFGR